MSDIYEEIRKFAEREKAEAEKADAVGWKKLGGAVNVERLDGRNTEKKQ